MRKGISDETIHHAIGSFLMRPRVTPLDNAVQHYDWGQPNFIPGLLGTRNPDGQPVAELWIGAHADLPSLAIVEGSAVPFNDLIKAAPLAILGKTVFRRYGARLPFLLKVLSARKPLSLQAHPNADQAKAGFDDENRRGIPLSQPNRNYRDPNHKPELLAALTDFHALRGFQPLHAIGNILHRTPELTPLSRYFEATDRSLRQLYRRIMTMEQHDINALLSPLIARLQRTQETIPFTPDQHEFWLLRADAERSAPGRHDRGLLALYLLNLVHLQPGQAIFLPSGELHAYLQGTGIEIMANSNNVLRGGMTPKHIDVAELQRILRFQAGPVQIIEPMPVTTRPNLLRYRTPAQEFSLTRASLTTDDHLSFDPGRIRIGLVISGQVVIEQTDLQPLSFSHGHAFMVPAASGCHLHCTEPAHLYLATVP